MSRKRSRSSSSSSSDSTSSSSSSSSSSGSHKKRKISKQRERKSLSEERKSIVGEKVKSYETNRLDKNTESKSRKRHDSSSSSSSEDSDDLKRKKRKEQKKLRKEKRRMKKKMKKEKKKMKKVAKKAKKEAKKEAKKKEMKALPLATPKTTATASGSIELQGPKPGPPIPELSDKAKAMKPMTKEEWDKRQQVIRKVYDEETGRHRLIKGDGEVLEEIVSKDRHREINRRATQGDGAFFQREMNFRVSR